MTTQNLMIIHPGRVLLEEFLAPVGISLNRLAKSIDVPTQRIFELVQGERSMSGDIAHRLAHYFGMSQRFWLDLQARYDLAMKNDRLSGRFDRQFMRRAF